MEMNKDEIQVRNAGEVAEKVIVIGIMVMHDHCSSDGMPEIMRMTIITNNEVKSKDKMIIIRLDQTTWSGYGQKG